MCGIAGLLAARKSRVPEELLLAMAGELAHRGPDGVGLYLDRDFGMVNTRLSIVDLAGGDQPLSAAQGRYWVMQNGEIYNYPELRHELERLGHRFESRSDTEVLAHAYAEWGKDCLDRLNGAFAFAVWDRTKRELFLARDRFGVRPLFLAEFGDGLAFASEMKALLRHPGARRELDLSSLVDSFTLWSTLPDRSPFIGIRELPAGHYLLVRAGEQPIERCWWRLDFTPVAGGRREDADSVADELRTLLEDAVRLRLRADVPVAAYLSGGLDSSLIAAIAHDITDQEVTCFCIGFTDRRFDETEFQDQLAKRLGLAVRRVEVDGRDIAEIFPRVIAMAERPMLRTAPAPLLKLSETVRDAGIKVVLTGEGADEMFAGYDIFKEVAVRRFWARQPQSRRRPLLLRRLYPWLGRDLSAIGPFLERFFGAELTQTENPLYSHVVRFSNTSRCLRLLDPELLRLAREQEAPSERLLRRLPPTFDTFSALGKAQYLEIETFLAGYLLHSQGDRMLMGNSVEGRFPFLDYRVAEFAARLPDRLRLRGLEEKYILRKAAAPLLPPSVAKRPKHPYRAPILRSFVGPGAPEYVRELTDAATIAARGIFSASAVTRLMAKCERGVEVGIGEMDEMALVGVLSTMLLDEQFVRRPRLADSLVPGRVVVGKDVMRTPPRVNAA